MKKLLNEDKITKVDDKRLSLMESIDPSKYNSVKEIGEACNAISIEEFRQLGLNRIKEMFETQNEGCNNQ